MFQRLDEVRFDGVLHEHGHSPFAAQLMNVDRVPIKVRANDNTAKAFLQVFNIIGQAKDSHDFGSNSDHEPGLRAQNRRVCRLDRQQRDGGLGRSYP